MIVHLVDGTYELFRYFLSPAAAFDRSAPEELRAVRGAMRLATPLAEQRERALLFRELARLRTDAPIGVDVDGLRWRGPRADFTAWVERLGTPALAERARATARGR